MTQTRILVLCGGQSEEHEVSITSANSLLRATEQSDLDITALVVTQQGQWLEPKESQQALRLGHAHLGGTSVLHGAKILEDYDVVFPLIHGPHGEDGTLQGMLELANIPYVGSGVLGSAICMDKAASKNILSAHNINQVQSCLVTQHAFAQTPSKEVERCSHMKGPWFVKPANLGSSVGISKARTLSELHDGINRALHFDRRVIVEEGVTGARELEVAILGNTTPKASVVGEITFHSDFYDYTTKYTPGQAQLHVPAQIGETTRAQIHQMALAAFAAHDCAGYARVDFFYQPTSGALFLNEINTIPGFTPLSMYPMLWEATGIPYSALIEQLVTLACEHHGAMNEVSA